MIYKCKLSISQNVTSCSQTCFKKWRQRQVTIRQNPNLEVSGRVFSTTHSQRSDAVLVLEVPLRVKASLCIRGTPKKEKQPAISQEPQSDTRAGSLCSLNDGCRHAPAVGQLRALAI